MEIEKIYQSEGIEEKWYQKWTDAKLFNSTVNKNKKAYTIVMPPPNVTGVLHMGHMLNNTIQDVLIRRARMMGYEACWVPGTDHASIATEAKVVKMLKDRGITKKDVSREEFLEYAWEWKEKYGSIILEQLKKLGVSCDWTRTRFTFEEDLSKAVTEVFVDLYNKGLIYKGIRMVNWDPNSQTAVSDEEVIHKETESKLYYIKYFLADKSNTSITIATTRPETILGDTAICVNPTDERYKHLVGKEVNIPLISRTVPIIEDEYVDKAFGSGCLKITPAHDINDYKIGQKHRLEVIDIFEPDGTLSSEATLYIGEDRFIARKKIVEDLKKNGHIEKIDTIKNNIGHSERTNAVIEPRISSQWFLNMKKMAKPALEVLENGQIKIFPAKFINLYRHWMENVHDWCISRQLWWGQRIPAYYCSTPDCREKIIVTENQPEICPNCSKKASITQDEDVVDTWFSSWLWPISVFDGFKTKNNEEINYYYPTDVLVTAPEILFFWVARMIMAGLEYQKDIPFKNIYLTGIVRDDLGQKMSKSLGNSPEPLELIKNYGADAVRVGMLLCSPAGNDLLYKESLIIQGRNFLNKIWNAYRLINSWETQTEAPIPHIATRWLDSRINEIIVKTDQLYLEFRISEALMILYKFFWDDFCSMYLEMIKPLKSEKISKDVLLHAKTSLVKILKMLHPYVPFITEELYNIIYKNEMDSFITIADYPRSSEIDEALLKSAKISFEIVGGVRNVKNKEGVKANEKVNLCLDINLQAIIAGFVDMVEKLSKVSSIRFSTDKLPGSRLFLIDNYECFLEFEEQKGVNEHELKIELDYLEGFLKIIDKKLSNPNFVQKAASVAVEREKEKKKDTEMKIMVIKQNLFSE